MTDPHPAGSWSAAAEEPDGPLALPLPPDTVLLNLTTAAEAALDAAARGDLAALALEGLRQQLTELGVDLPLDGLPDAPPRWGSLLRLGALRLQLVCAPFWADAVAVPTGSWGEGGQAPQLLVGAWVDPETAAVRLPGVLSAGELAGLEPAPAAASAALQLELAAFRGGCERLFSLARVLLPEALPGFALAPAAGAQASEVAGADPLLPASTAAPPAPIRPSSGSEAHQPSTLERLAGWLEGQLGTALLALGAELLPPPAAAFRAATSSLLPAALASVAIPLALVDGEIRWGAARRGASERFRLVLRLCGAADEPERLEVRLEPELAGDLLPEHLRLEVAGVAVGPGGEAGAGPLVLTVPADERPIEIRLRQPGSSDLVLPALSFRGSASDGPPPPAP